MPTDVRCLVTNDGTQALVRATGTLDPAGARKLRDVLLAQRADHPGRVVVEVSGLRVSEPDGWAVFADVRAAAAEWPLAELLLCAESEVASQDWIGHGVAVSRTAAEALAGRVPQAVLDVPLAPAVGAARHARELVTDACRRWRVPGLAGPGCIAVTEMVNNVVTHAHTTMVLRLVVRDGALRLAVRDWSVERPSYAGLVPPTATGGRGLLLIDAVARQWGDTPVADGKVVWAVLYPEDADEY